VLYLSGPFTQFVLFFPPISPNSFAKKTQRGERKALVRVPFHHSPSLLITWWYPIHAYIRASYGGGKGIVILSTSRLSTYAPQQCDCGAGGLRLEERPPVPSVTQKFLRVTQHSTSTFFGRTIIYLLPSLPCLYVASNRPYKTSLCVTCAGSATFFGEYYSGGREAHEVSF
jgi:hypothetical protein